MTDRRLQPEHSFEGIDAPNTTPVPDIYFDVLFPRLGKGQLKVLLYIVRRTFGFKKEGDTISLSQICQGIRRRDGTILDRGTGLKRGTATAAIRDLEEMGVILARRSLSSRGDAATTYYAPRFKEQLSVTGLLDQDTVSAGTYRFPGIDAPNTTPVPDAYFDLLLPELGLAEWRVLLYVVRRTFGFKKLSDAISLDQFEHGIVTTDGRRLDQGTGLSRFSVTAAVSNLVMRNVLIRKRVSDPYHGDGVSVYGLAIRESARLALSQRLGLTSGHLAQAAGQHNVHNKEVNQSNYPGIAQSDYPGIKKPNYQGVEQLDYPKPPNRTRLTTGVNETDHSGVKETDHPLSKQQTTPGSSTDLPVGPLMNPQDIDKQETAEQQTDHSLRFGDQQQTTGVVVLHTDEEIANYPLGAHEVLIETATGDALVVALDDLVRHDIEETSHNYGLRIATDCYYSTDQFLGRGGEEWTAEEDRKRQYHLVLRRELESLYADIGAFSIDEGLLQYFSADYVARRHSEDPDEQQRQRGWLRYIRSEAGQNLQNPAGFLRTRLESSQWPPRGAARGRSRKG